MAKKELGYIKLLWECPNCDTSNPGPKRLCINCGAPQPEDVKFYSPQELEILTDEATQTRAEKGPDKHCPYCLARNTGDAVACIQCGGDLEDAEIRLSGKRIDLPGEDKSTIICPHCGEGTHPDFPVCQSCNAPIGLPIDEEVSLAQPKPSKGEYIRSNFKGIAIIVAVIIMGAIALFSYLFSTEEVNGELLSMAWVRSIPIQALIPVQHNAWRDQIPSGAEIGGCSERVREVVSHPAPNSVEVCGEPYVVDTGSGYGEVVQDCQYQVYDTFCSYSSIEWSVVDTAQYSGRNSAVNFTEFPQISSEQQFGEESVSYTAQFNTNDGIVEWITSDIELMSSARENQTWILKINKLGKIVDAYLP